MTDDELRELYQGLEPSFGKALEDTRWDLEQYSMKDMPSFERSVFETARVSTRVKSIESFVRKCKREGIQSYSEIPHKITDLLGIRIATANKNTAADLFKHFRGRQDSWFCKIDETPKFVPYTIEDKNNYSLRSGYQAYHIIFVCQKQYAAFSDASQFPVEIQIMSRLWEFWAEYSREYFYGSELLSSYLPYNVAISKILDSADDLMTITTERIREDAGSILENTELSEQDFEEITQQAGGAELITVSDFTKWFVGEGRQFFGAAKVPNEFFLSVIVQFLSDSNIQLETLSEILSDQSTDSIYNEILKSSSLSFLPTYQQIIAKSLIFWGLDEEEVIEIVNRELRPLGMVLYPR